MGIAGVGLIFSCQITAYLIAVHRFHRKS